MRYLLVVIGFVLAGCGSSDSVAVCEPGATQACTCPSGSGAQTCANSGNKWLTCECADGGTTDDTTTTGDTGADTGDTGDPTEETDTGADTGEPLCPDGDCAPSSAKIITPVADAAVCGVVTIEATASDDNGITVIRFEVDGVLIGTDDASPYQQEWDSALASDGEHTIAITAFDAKQQSAGDSITVTVSQTGEACDDKPNVVITAPSAGGDTVYVTGTVEITADASDDVGVKKVEFYVDNALLGEDTSTPFALSWKSTDFDEGAHSLKAIAYDTGGQTATAQLEVTLDHTAPKVTIVSPTSTTYTDLVPLEAAIVEPYAIASVVFQVKGQAAKTLYEPPWNWQVSGLDLPNGVSTLDVVATDGAGNVGKAVSEFSVCNPQCAGKVCGSDGCGGTCGDCGCGEDCFGGACVFNACVGKACGPDGCGGTCGTCDCGETCTPGATCVFTACSGQECGDDGCGGICGFCGPGDSCDGAVCVCSPSCAGGACNDGCGGACPGAPPAVGSSLFVGHIVSLSVPSDAATYGCDANNDGKVDADDGTFNTVLTGPLIGGVVDLNQGLADNIESGATIYLLELFDYIGADTDKASLHMYQGSSISLQPDPACGVGPDLDDSCDWLVDPASLDGCIAATNVNTSVSGQTLAGGPDDTKFQFPFAGLPLDLPLNDARVGGTLGSGSNWITAGRLCGNFPKQAFLDAVEAACVGPNPPSFCAFKALIGNIFTCDPCTITFHFSAVAADSLTLGTP